MKPVRVTVLEITIRDGRKNISVGIKGGDKGNNQAAISM